MTRRHPVRAFVFAAFAFFLVVASARADVFDEPMVFVLAENSRHDMQWIAAIGTITMDTPAAFEKFAKTVKRKGMWIEFSSPGGSVVASLQLGEMIRERGFNTDVAFTILRGHGKDSLAPGYCLSACGYAFLGGVKRDVQERSVLGYHQFFRDPKVKMDAATDAAMSKQVTAYIAIYLNRMGVGAKLLDLASKTKPTDYYEPDSDERIKLHIVTDGEDREQSAEEEATPPTSVGKRSDVVPRGPEALAALRCA
jgi:hypothetical protein